MALLVDIEKTMGQFHLKVSFQANSSEIFGLLGESGCGKSMTLKCIAGIEKPDRGRICLNGRVLFDSDQKIDLPPRKRKVGYLFQDYALFPNLTVSQNIAIVLKDQKEAENYMKKFYLQGLEKHYPSMLSGGQKQRCAIARMMAAKPEVLLLDEPFSAVDGTLKRKLEMQMMEMFAETKNPVVFVSHDHDEIYHFCHSVGILEEGCVKEIGKKEQVFLKPSTVAAAKIIGCENIFPVPEKEYTHIGIPSYAIKRVEKETEAKVKGVVKQIFSEREEEILIVAAGKELFSYRQKYGDSKRTSIGEKVFFSLDESKIWYLS